MSAATIGFIVSLVQAAPGTITAITDLVKANKVTVTTGAGAPMDPQEVLQIIAAVTGNATSAIKDVG